MGDTATESDGPTSVILDTDMATDCDDAGALALLYALERRGEAETLATVVNNGGAHSAGTVAAINSFYDRSEVPIGAYQGDLVGTEPAPFFTDIARDTATYGHSVTTRDQVPSAVDVYRRVLAEAGPNEVVIVSIGHLNNLYELLRSEADRHSDSSGAALVERTVSGLVVMGGEYPSGTEHNFSARRSAQFTGPVLTHWPTPIRFSGYELGENVLTGPALSDLAESHPVRRAYAGHPSEPLQNGRPSWDQTAVLAAVRDPERYWKLSDPGRVTVEPDGRNSWMNDPDGTHEYLIERRDPAPSGVAAVIENLMVEMPDSRE